MDSYLEIAKKVLVEARRSLNARQILKIAYQMQIVPADLFGRTQHKTLQARLSTEILTHRSRTDFFRTGPGMFSLRSVRGKHGSPVQREYVAPVRAAQLGRFEVVTFARSSLSELWPENGVRLRTLDLTRVATFYPKLRDLPRDESLVVLRLMVLLLHEGALLLRHARPIEVGSLPFRTAAGFEGLVRRDDRQLFSEDAFGLLEAALRTAAEGLGLSALVVSKLQPLTGHCDAPFIFEEDGGSAEDDLIAFVAFDCTGVPEVIEATQGKGSFDWQDLPVRTNDLDRFDRWSARIVEDRSLQMAVVGRS